MKPDQGQPRLLSWALVQGVTLGGLSLVVELLRGHRADSWSGWQTPEIFGAALVGFAFVVFIGGASLIAGCVVRRFAPRAGGWWVVPCAGLLAYAAIWTPLFLIWEGVRLEAVALAALAGAGLTSLSLILTRWARISLAHWCLIVVAVCAATIAAMAASAYAFILEPAVRASAVAHAGTIWLICGLFGMVFIALVTRNARKWSWVFLAGGAIVLAAAPWGWYRPSAAGERAQAGKPNLVFILCDAMRADYGSLYGGPVPMPAMERLAEQGVLFKHCYSLAPWTAPSMAAMMGSAYPPNLFPPDGSSLIPQGGPWLAWPGRLHFMSEELEEAGYATGALIGNNVVRLSAGLLDDFDTRLITGHPRYERRTWFRQTPFAEDALAWMAPVWMHELPTDTTRTLLHWAQAFVRAHHDEPFYLYVHFLDPHSPYAPPAAYRAAGAPDVISLVHASNGLPAMDLITREMNLDESMRVATRGLYEGEMRYVDWAIGELLSELERWGVRDRTVICVTADHGEEFWDHGRVYHGHSLHNEQIWVPLIVSAPGIEPHTVDAPFSHIDLMPTLAGLIGAEAPAEWRGSNLAAALREEDLSGAETTPFFQGTHAVAGPMRGVVVGEEKFIEDLLRHEEELYDLSADPGEHTNMVNKRPEKAAAYGQRLLDWAATFPDTFEEVYGGAAPEMTQDERDAMEAMGYL